MAAPEPKEVKGMLEMPNVGDISLLLRSIWKARCLILTMQNTWMKELNLPSADDLRQAQKFLSSAHSWIIFFREDVGEICLGLAHDGEAIQTDIINQINTPESSPADKE